MIILYILLAVLGLILLLTLLNIHVFALYEDELTLSIRVAFVKLRLLPPKPEKKPAKPKKKKKTPENRETEKKKEPNKLLEYFRQKGVSGILNIVKRLAKLAASTLKGLFARVTIKKLVIRLRIAGDDAADSAVKYGYVCSALFPALKVLTDIMKVKRYDVDVNPDFSDKPQNYAYAEAEAKIRIISILIVLLPKVVEGLKLFIKARPKSNKKVKGE